MGLPRYIINYEELEPFLKEAVGEAKIPVSISEIDFSGITSASLDTAVIEAKMTSIIDINTLVNTSFDDLITELKLVSDKLSTLNTDNSEKLSKFNEEKVQAYLDETIKTRELVESIVEQLQPFGNQRIQGYYKYVPPGRHDYIIEFASKDDIYLTALTMSQIGWKLEDTWSLRVDGNDVFTNIPTKEVAEKKSFTRYMKVDADVKIEFVLHNKSGNSRQLWVDFEYVLTTG
jgi:hypothetical protein